MNAYRLLAVPLLFLAASYSESSSGGELDSIKRDIGRQPAYTAEQPLFALAVFGPEADSRMWMVADKSQAAGTDYDVLYIDLNGDGDLTGENERLTRDDSARFQLPVLVEPKRGVKHTQFSVRLTEGSRPVHMLSMMWRGERKFGGGYPVDPAGGYMRFGKSPQEAPIVWLNGDGPFRFQPWYNEPMKIGGATDLKLFLGQAGIGINAFCAFQQHVLPPDEGVVATLIYTDQEGVTREATSNLDRRC